jgi:O-antigen/teichoic acid export membrane protein
MTAAQSPDARGLAHDAVYTFGGRIARTLLAVGLSVLVARVLGPHERGLYALPTAVYTGFVLAVFTGISLAVSYFLLNTDAGRDVIRAALLTGAVFTAGGAIPVVAMAILGHNAWACVPALLLLPANVPPMMVLGYSIGRKHIRWQTTFFIVTAALQLAAMAAAFLFFPHSAPVAVTAFVTISLVIAAACLIFVVRDARVLPPGKVALVPFMLFAARVGIVNLVTLLNNRADLYVVALLATPAVLGEYAVAISAAESLLIVTQVAATVTSPHVGSMERDAAAQLTAKCIRLTFVIAFLVCAAFYVVAPQLVGFIYGSAYLPLVPALRILLVAVLILSIGSPIGNFFTLKMGKPEVSLVSQICAATLCVVASWFLVPRIGMIGAASATAIAYLVGQAIALTFFTRTTKISLAGLLLPTRRDLDSYARLGRALVRQ